MRIGIITHNYPKTSKERQDAGIFLYDFAQELAKTHKVFVLCPDFEGEKEVYKKVPVTWYKWSGGKQKLGSLKAYNPQSLYQLFSLVKNGISVSEKFALDNKLDFIVAAWAFPAGYLAYSVHKKLDIPYATWSLGSDINQYANVPFLKQLIISSLKNAEVRFANSYLLCNKIEKLSGKKAEFLPAITDFSAKGAKAKDKSKKFQFLFVGRLEKVKGPDILLEAVKILSKKAKDFEVTFLGDGSLRQDLEDTANKLGLSNVKFLGNADKERVLNYMLSSDSLVIASRSESFPLVLIEAIKVGLPAVATDVGDCKRIIETHNIGYVATPNNPHSLANSMDEALKQGKKFKLSKANNLKNVSKEFEQEYAVTSLIKFMRG